MKDFDPNLPVQKRAEILHRAVERNQIGEALSLLVIAEESLFQWQRLRIARIAATEPEHLSQVVDDARDLLAREVVEDGKLYALGHRVLDSFSKSEALEGFFFWAVRGLAGNRCKLRTDLDAFAHARRSQAAEWEEHRTPGLLDAISAAVDVVARPAAEALAQTWAGVVKLSGHLRGTSAEEAPTRPASTSTSPPVRWTTSSRGTVRPRVGSGSREDRGLAGNPGKYGLVPSGRSSIGLGPEVKVPPGPTTKPTCSRWFTHATFPAPSTPQAMSRKPSRVFGGSGSTSPAVAKIDFAVVENPGSPDLRR